MFWNNFKSIFLATKGSISSKRVCGVLGWIACLFVLIYCTLVAIEAPSMVDSIIIATASLLGIDSVTNIWKDRSSDDEKSELPKE